MLDSDDFILEGTNLDEYHEYQRRIVAESAASPIIERSEIIALLQSLGINTDSVRGLGETQ
jgi:hypothetical protein